MIVASTAASQFPKLDDLLKGAGGLPQMPAAGQGVGAGDEKTNADGIREALAVGTERAVKSLSQVNGYFGNAAVKILMPSSIQKVDEVGATRAYKAMMGRYESVPMVGSQSLDLDHYVTEKSLDGLFYMVGQDEKKIRTNPVARTTGLLKQVFGK